MNQPSLFEQEIAEEEKTQNKKSREKRSLNLIADFDENGFAKGWYFAVGEFFRDQLDIKYTQRKEDILDDNGKPIYVDKKDKKGNPILNKNGSVRKQKKTKTVMKWTQGSYYCFSEGQVIYDTPDAYRIWHEALEKINERIEIIRGVPKSPGIEGEVFFKLEKNDHDTNKFDTIGTYHLNQSDFVDFLKTGKRDKLMKSLFTQLSSEA